MNNTNVSDASIPPTPDKGVGAPHKGDAFRCSACGMAISVTADCKCQNPEQVHFHCCGQEMQKS